MRSLSSRSAGTGAGHAALATLRAKNRQRQRAPLLSRVSPSAQTVPMLGAVRGLKVIRTDESYTDPAGEPCMKVLLVSKHIPYQATNGIEVKINNLIACMKAVSDVTCVFIVDNTEHNERLISRLSHKDRAIVCKIGKLSASRYLSHLKSVLFVDKNINTGLDEIINKVNPDVIWLEFGYICHLIPCLKKHAKPVFYASHNSQWKLDFAIWKANQNPMDKLKMAPFMVLYWLQERFFMRLADRFFCISRQDIEYYGSYVARHKLGLLPFFFDYRKLLRVSPFVAAHPYVCIVGSLRSYQNFLGVVYALGKIWPKIQSSLLALQLYVVGELPAENSRDYRLLMLMGRKFPQVIFTGKVETVIPYVKGALVNIVPLTLGSGVRTKIIESAACRTPVVSTALGAEGLPFEDGTSILIADDPGGFANHVIDLVEKPDLRLKISEQAFDVYLRELSFEAGTAALVNIFAEFSPKEGGNLRSGARHFPA